MIFMDMNIMRRIVQTLVRNNRVYVNLGDKAIVMSPHIMDEFETARGKIKKIQSRLRNRLEEYFNNVLRELISRIKKQGVNKDNIDTILDSVGSVSDPSFDKDIKSYLLNSVFLGGQHGLNKVLSEQERAKQIAGERPRFRSFFREDPKTLIWVNNQSGSLIKNIDDYTLSETRILLVDGINKGLEPREIAANLKNKFSDWSARRPGIQSRADMIARTETARAMNQGTLLGYEQSKVVKCVEVMDNEVRGSCLRCSEVNGQRWTIEYAESHEIEHCNCTRAFSPIMEEMTPAEMELYNLDKDFGSWSLDQDMNVENIYRRYPSLRDYDRLLKSWTADANYAGLSPDSIVRQLKTMGYHKEESSSLLRIVSRSAQWDLSHRFPDARYIRLYRGMGIRNIAETKKILSVRLNGKPMNMTADLNEAAIFTITPESAVVSFDVPIKSINSYFGTSYAFLPDEREFAVSTKGVSIFGIRTTKALLGRSLKLDWFNPIIGMTRDKMEEAGRVVWTL